MKMKTKVYTEVTIPAGRYYLGDPCYVIRDEDWHPLLENCNYFIDRPVGEVGGYQILAFSTKHGDGTFHDQHKNEYDVDAGLIGLVPVGYGAKEHENREVEFKSPTLCWDEDGVLHFGRITINTDYSDE